MAGVGPGEGGLGWSVDCAGPTVTTVWPGRVPKCPDLQRLSGLMTMGILQRPQTHLGSPAGGPLDCPCPASGGSWQRSLGHSLLVHLGCCLLTSPAPISAFSALWDQDATN